MDIVERLRREEDRLDDEAADEIERLRIALQEILREIDDEWDGKYGIDGLRHIACKALGEKE